MYMGVYINKRTFKILFEATPVSLAFLEITLLPLVENKKLNLFIFSDTVSESLSICNFYKPNLRNRP